MLIRHPTVLLETGRYLCKECDLTFAPWAAVPKGHSPNDGSWPWDRTLNFLQQGPSPKEIRRMIKRQKSRRGLKQC